MQVGITEANDGALNEDWVKWVNEDSPTILITKNIPLLFQKHPELFFKKNVIFHATCTGLGGTFIEPNVPKPEMILEWLKKRAPEFLKRVVLRCDPICPPLIAYNTPNFNGEVYFYNLKKILQTAKDLNLRIRISFLDMYHHVAERFLNTELKDLAEKYYHNKLHLSLEYRQKMLEMFNTLIPQNYEVCGEPGMNCSGCVSLKDLEIFGITPPQVSTGLQREGCACLALKKELCKTRGPCNHGCLYCYWK